MIKKVFEGSQQNGSLTAQISHGQFNDLILNARAQLNDGARITLKYEDSINGSLQTKTVLENVPVSSLYHTYDSVQGNLMIYISVGYVDLSGTGKLYFELNNLNTIDSTNSSWKFKIYSSYHTLSTPHLNTLEFIPFDSKKENNHELKDVVSILWFQDSFDVYEVNINHRDIETAVNSNELIALGRNKFNYLFKSLNGIPQDVNAVVKLLRTSNAY